MTVQPRHLIFGMLSAGTISALTYLADNTASLGVHGPLAALITTVATALAAYIEADDEA